MGNESIARHVRGLDGLRGIAVLIVLAVHFGLPGARSGIIGLDIFFVLSGFLITRIICLRAAGPGGLSLPWFYRRRAERVMPALYVMLLFMTALTLAMKMPWKPHHFFHEIVPTALFSGQFTRLVPRAMPFAHTWSLGVEAWFYVLWPPLLVLALRRRLALRVLVCSVVLGAAALAAARYHEMTTLQPLPRWLHHLSIWRLDSLSIGCLLGLGVEHLKRLGVWRDRLGGCAFVILLALIAADDFMGAVRWQCLAAALCTATLVAALAGSGGSWMARVLEFRPVRWVGEISYGAYVWHLPLALMAKKWLPAGPGRFAAMFAVSLFAGACSYYLVERRFMDGRSSDPDKRRTASPATA